MILGTTTNITTVETGSQIFDNANAYADISTSNSNYPNGDFSMALPNGTGTTSVTAFSLTGDTYPDVPKITGGTWSGGKLLINPTQNYTLNFTAFGATFVSGSKIEFKIEGPGSDGHEVSSSTDINSFFIPAGSFVLADGSTTSTSLQFINIIDTDTSISGATGFTGYVTILSFKIQAIPEPSTYAAILGALALTGVMIARRRQRD